MIEAVDAAHQCRQITSAARLLPLEHVVPKIVEFVQNLGVLQCILVVTMQVDYELIGARKHVIYVAR